MSVHYSYAYDMSSESIIKYSVDLSLHCFTFLNFVCC